MSFYLIPSPPSPYLHLLFPYFLPSPLTPPPFLYFLPSLLPPFFHYSLPFSLPLFPSFLLFLFPLLLLYLSISFLLSSLPSPITLSSFLFSLSSSLLTPPLSLYFHPPFLPPFSLPLFLPFLPILLPISPLLSSPSYPPTACTNRVSC